MADAPALPGTHNAQNAAAAAAMAFALGATRTEVAQGIGSASPACRTGSSASARVDGVAFINDSKATNADAASRALGCYERIVWIAGGIAKEGGIEPLAPFFPRVAHALLIGRDAPAFAATLPRTASRTRSPARWRPPCPPPSPPRAATGGARRAALARLRQLRPVQRLRGARRPLRRARRGPGAREGRLMPALSRADNSTLGRWWWTVDRWTLVAVGTLIGFGYVMMLAASPAVAERIGQSRDVFILKQVFFLALAGAIVVGVSLLSPRQIRRLALVGCIVALMLTAATMVIGVEIKGARRWIALPGMSLQPSEFLKPCFAVVAAWLISEGKRTQRASPACSIAVSRVRPDRAAAEVAAGYRDAGRRDGRVLRATLCRRAQSRAGRRRRRSRCASAAVGAYTLFPHVQSRVQRFLHPDTGDSYQVTTALEAFGNGGLLGRGPGEGRVKDVLPDAHADFVYAVAGEEFGMMVCIVILSLFAFIVLRGLLRLLKEQDLFVVLASTGLVTGFGLQAFVNMASYAASDPDQGHDLALHLLWRLLGDGGGARHGNAAGADAAAASRGHRREGPGRQTDRHRRGRHRRPLLPGRGAGVGTGRRAAIGSR